MIYAGIGARKTPKDVLDMMKVIGMLLGIAGHKLQTGAAKGADQAFANGAIITGKVTLCLPWVGYEHGWTNQLPSANCSLRVLTNKDKKAYANVDKYHPAPKRLSQGVRKLFARNSLILNGAKFVVCWTPEGKITGGTGHALHMAKDNNIPIYNLYHKDMWRTVLQKYAT